MSYNIYFIKFMSYYTWVVIKLYYNLILIVQTPENSTSPRAKNIWRDTQVPIHLKDQRSTPVYHMTDSKYNYIVEIYISHRHNIYIPVTKCITPQIMMQKWTQTHKMKSPVEGLPMWIINHYYNYSTLI